MIYSISQQREIPVTVSKTVQYVDNKTGEVIFRYTVSDAIKPSEEIGYVDLSDTKNGVHVSYIKKYESKKYKHFGQVADQIELEHCLKRGIDKPYIQSVAAIGSYIQHFKRGKRFANEGTNIYFDILTKNLLKGEKVETGVLGYQRMYMPMKLINELKEKIKINPLLKFIK